MNLQNNIDPDQSGSSKSKPENYLPKGSSETNTRSTSQKLQKRNNDPDIPRLKPKQIADFRDKSNTYQNTLAPGESRYGFGQKMTLTQKDTHGESQVLEAIQALFGRVGKLYKVNETTRRLELNALGYHRNILAYLLKFPLYSKKRLACFRSYRIYLLREKINNKKLKLDGLPETVAKHQRLCKRINQQAEEQQQG